MEGRQEGIYAEAPEVEVMGRRAAAGTCGFSGQPEERKRLTSTRPPLSARLAGWRAVFVSYGEVAKV